MHLPRGDGCARVFAPRRSRAQGRPPLSLLLAEIFLDGLEFAQSVVQFLFELLGLVNGLRAEGLRVQAFLFLDLRERLLELLFERGQVDGARILNLAPR